MNLTTVRDVQNIAVEKKILKTKEGKLPKDFDSANLNNLFVGQVAHGMKLTRKSYPDLMMVLYALCTSITL